MIIFHKWTASVVMTFGGVGRESSVGKGSPQQHVEVRRVGLGNRNAHGAGKSFGCVRERKIRIAGCLLPTRRALQGQVGFADSLVQRIDGGAWRGSGGN
jgi:hypothetical protein